MATRPYELMVILDPAQSEDQQQETLTHIEEVITKYGGELESRDVWGKRRLAYTINKRRDGWYALINFQADPAEKTLSELELYCRIRDEIMRHLVVERVVGRSKGDPSRLQNVDFGRFGGPRGGGRRDSRPPRDREERSYDTEKKSSENAPAAEAENAEAKSEASAETS